MKSAESVAHPWYTPATNASGSAQSITPTVDVSPSQFAFLWDDCHRCYFNETLGIRRRPRTPFPSVFGAIDRAMKERFDDGLWHHFGGNQPAFRVEATSKFVKSRVINATTDGIKLRVRGSYDSVLIFEDGSRAVCDFKTAPVREDFLGKYARQLHAYAFAIENPAQGAGKKVDRLGLAVFEPDEFREDATNRASLSGAFQWIELVRDDAAFRAFLNEVADLLSGPLPPPNPACVFCLYPERAA